MYEVVDFQVGKVFFQHEDYDVAVQMYFRVFDMYEYPEDDTYLQLVDNKTGKAVSVVER